MDAITISREQLDSPASVEELPLSPKTIAFLQQRRFNQARQLLDPMFTPATVLEADDTVFNELRQALRRHHTKWAQVLKRASETATSTPKSTRRAPQKKTTQRSSARSQFAQAEDQTTTTAVKQGATAARSMATQPAEVDQSALWEAYKADTSRIDLRNQLIEMYMPLVRYIAERIWARVPKQVELDDLVSAGVFGLMDAVDGFDLTRGLPFTSYCVPRIRGAMLDELRLMDWVPRAVRSKESKLEEARKALQAELGRQPTAQELADHLSMSVVEFEKMMAEANVTRASSLSKKWYESDWKKDLHGTDIEEDRKGDDPTLRSHNTDLLRTLTVETSTRERLIIIMYFYEKLSFKEIGAALDVSEALVQQMHADLVVRIAARLNDQPESYHQRNQVVQFLLEEMAIVRKKIAEEKFDSTVDQQRAIMRLYNSCNGRERGLQTLLEAELSMTRSRLTRMNRSWNETGEGTLTVKEQQELEQLEGNFSGVEREFQRKTYRKITPIKLQPQMRRAMRIYYLRLMRGDRNMGKHFKQYNLQLDAITYCEKVFGPQSKPLIAISNPPPENTGNIPS